MKEAIEHSKKVIKESTALTWQELEKKKIELEAKSQLLATTIGWATNPSYYAT